MDELKKIADYMVTPGKGILASDEPPELLESKFQQLGVANNEETRRTYRELLYGTHGLEQYVAAAILHRETFEQKAKKGILPGITVDQGFDILPGTTQETITLGLDSLSTQCASYQRKGAKFTKWRPAFRIVDDISPSAIAISTNAELVGCYAAICQQYGLVPIIESDVLLEGSYTIETCAKVSKMVLEEIYSSLKRHQVYLQGVVAKPNMVLAGLSAKSKPDPSTVAKYTLDTLLDSVPASVPGIAFLSGGQTEQEATTHLEAIHRQAKMTKQPWQLTFCYGRALQATCLQTWKGKAENVEKAREQFLYRCKVNALAYKAA
ncbi:fructose-bisphosphate aldolase, class I [Galdieria sulphuraria]|uniref:fructose-bisphosphate aldolase n=1 Tax=Galdieria sulphuraria TaxID=130081 RepID=M2XWW2_GALSU|nr:fructose-bisphosphate aldolase, class I [Galdieria sulphuraria]EME28118.1 fructose-bisphosphate aldolase, class I [Galdieria sulphuraria]|eukprot:XP_005704638.1 fructose-bisphosphate aldolase, class I [Galdieria sulphuraria]